MGVGKEGSEVAVGTVALTVEMAGLAVAARVVERGAVWEAARAEEGVVARAVGLGGQGAARVVVAMAAGKEATVEQGAARVAAREVVEKVAGMEAARAAAEMVDMVAEMVEKATMAATAASPAGEVKKGVRALQ